VPLSRLTKDVVGGYFTFKRKRGQAEALEDAGLDTTSFLLSLDAGLLDADYDEYKDLTKCPDSE